MATGVIHLPVPAPTLDPTSPPSLPDLSTSNGRPYLILNAATDQIWYWTLRLPGDYASAASILVGWSAATATTGNTVWQFDVMTVAPNVDTASMLTDSYDAANWVQDAHLGTNAGRLHEATVALTNFDGGAAGQYIAIRGRRDADSTNAVDDMAGDAYLWHAQMTYTTT